VLWIIVIVWLVFGYFFARWFANDYLDDGKWADTGKHPGAVHLIMLTGAGPAMAVILVLFHGLNSLGHTNAPSAIKKFYGVKD
jgi:CDP-diglyceride synthetase